MSAHPGAAAHSGTNQVSRLIQSELCKDWFRYLQVTEVSVGMCRVRNLGSPRGQVLDSKTNTEQILKVFI